MGWRRQPKAEVTAPATGFNIWPTAAGSFSTAATVFSAAALTTVTTSGDSEDRWTFERGGRPAVRAAGGAPKSQLPTPNEATSVLDVGSWRLGVEPDPCIRSND